MHKRNFGLVAKPVAVAKPFEDIIYATLGAVLGFTPLIIIMLIVLYY